MAAIVQQETSRQQLHVAEHVASIFVHFLVVVQDDSLFVLLVQSEWHASTHTDGDLVNSHGH